MSLINNWKKMEDAILLNSGYPYYEVKQAIDKTYPRLNISYDEVEKFYIETGMNFLEAKARLLRASDTMYITEKYTLEDFIKDTRSFVENVLVYFEYDWSEFLLMWLCVSIVDVLIYDGEIWCDMEAVENSLEDYMGWMYEEVYYTNNPTDLVYYIHNLYNEKSRDFNPRIQDKREGLINLIYNNGEYL